VRDGTNRPRSKFPFGGGRYRTNGTNGVHPEGMRTRAIPLNEIDDPIDLVAVQADDELINALRAGMTVSAPGRNGHDAVDQVASMLAAWKAEVDAEPIPELVDIDAAMAAIEAARPPATRRARRHLAPVAAAAAFVVLALGGVSIGSADSEPGDALWSVSKVLYSERAESVEAAARVETRISTAKKALAEGKTAVAAHELTAAQADLASVRPQEGKADLTAVQSFLEAKADETPPGVPTDPGTPLKKDRARTVPKGAGLTEAPKPSGSTTAPTPDPVLVNPVSPAGPPPSESTAPLQPSDPGGPETTAPTTTPVPRGGGGRDAEPQSIPPTSAVPEGEPTTTTPGQGLGGTVGAPTSTTASGTGTTSPAAGTS
jgi:Anti-sigma-D factor RsdA to sigma factor binding region